MRGIISALIGAMAAGLLQIILREVDRRREQASILVAIVSEVSVICELVRYRKYLEGLTEIILQMELNLGAKIDVLVDIREDYFKAYNALVGNLGKIDAKNASCIVKFYTVCRSIIDSVHRDGVISQVSDPILVLQSHRQLRDLIEQALRLGDEIVQFPKSPAKQSLLANGKR